MILFNTLSNDNDLEISTSGMSEGYVNTKIYANSIGVFSGRSYIPGNNTSIYINVNDIAAQNHGKDDYLKLNSNGNLNTLPVINDTYGTYNVNYRFVQGQIGLYKAQITDGTSTTSNQDYILAGYDYNGKDIRPAVAKDISTNIYVCRVMQGCDWYGDSPSAPSTFDSLLLPHYPNIPTTKYGFGIQLYAADTPNPATFPYYLSSTQDRNYVVLGNPIFKYSNSTFLNLFDLLTGLQINTGENSTVYLKSTSNSNAFIKQHYNDASVYYRDVNLQGIKVYRYVGSTLDSSVTYYVGQIRPEIMLYYITQFNTAAGFDWVPIDIVRGNKVVYTTPEYDNYTPAMNDANSYQVQHQGKFQIRDEEGYSKVEASAVMDQTQYEVFVPAHNTYNCPVAVIDGCYSRYYLAWNDRYGDIQSQPFEGKVEYTEDVKTEEVEDYKNKRRVSNKLVQSKWRLNTKWISEKVYPIYESIFTSPYLLLYDTEFDRSWNVIVTDSNYKEKSFRTEKSLVNFEIEVEEAKKQNMIY